jgi:hypothetical protein
MTIREARPYLALSLLEQTLPKFSSMLIRRVGVESTCEKDETTELSTKHFRDIYYPTRAELQGYIHGYNMMHKDYSYDPYIDDNTTQTDRQLRFVSPHEIKMPSLWLQSKADILELCHPYKALHRYSYTTIDCADDHLPHEIGCAEGRDFKDLIQPDMMSSNLLDYIFYSQFPSTQTQVAYISTEVSNAIISCDLRFDELSSNEVLYGPLMHTCHTMFKTPIMIFGFCHGQHITGIITSSELRDNTYILRKLVFLDSLQGDGAQSVEAVLAFLQWLSIQKAITLEVTDCQFDLRPTRDMIRQRCYRPPGSIPNT